MAAINFPNSPAPNDAHIVGSLNYVYDGAKWTGGGNSPVDKIYADDSTVEIVDTGGSSGYFIVSPEGNEAFRVNATGKLLFNNASGSIIGGQSSSGKLTLFGGATNQGGQIDLYGGSNSDGIISFRTGSGAGEQTEKLRIESDGDLEYKYSDADTAAEVGATQVPHGLRIYNTNNTLGRLAGIHFSHGGGGTANAGIFHVTTNTSNTSTYGLGDLTFYTKNSSVSNMTEKLRITSGGDVLIGDSAGQIGKLSTLGTGNHISAIRHSDDESSSNVLFVKYRGSRSSPAIIVDGDMIGDLAWYGYNGSSIIKAASISASASSTVDGSNMPTDLIFKTTYGNTNHERLRIASNGAFGIGGANYGTDGQVLTSTGLGSAPAWEDAGGFDDRDGWLFV